MYFYTYATEIDSATVAVRAEKNIIYIYIHMLHKTTVADRIEESMNADGCPPQSLICRKGLA